MSKWADAIAKALTRHSGMVRLDFQPASPIECSKLIANARKICDEITTYLESNIQTGDNISVESKDNIFGTVHKTVKGDIKYNKSSSASVSWKGISSKLSDLKKEAEYFIQLLSDTQKQGWTVEMTVSADLGKGELQHKALSHHTGTAYDTNAIVFHRYILLFSARIERLCGKIPKNR